MFKATTLVFSILLRATLAEAETVERPTRIEIDTHIDLPFTASEVWAVLADPEGYPDWNPYHVRVDGELLQGERLEVEIHKPNDHQLVIHPRVMTVAPQRRLVWGGGVPGVFRGVHRFDLQPISDTCTRLHHTEVFAGLFVGFAELDSIEPGYVGMNEALLSHLTDAAKGRIGGC